MTGEPIRFGFGASQAKRAPQGSEGSTRSLTRVSSAHG